MNWIHAKALKEERAKAVADMQTMLGKANEEKRDLTSAETESFDTLHKRAEDIKGQLDRYDAAQKLAAELANKPGSENRQQPGREDVNTAEQKADQQAAEARSQFDTYLRTG